MELTKAEKDLILHMTGSYGKKNQGQRNYGAFSPSTKDHEVILGLVAKDLAKRYLVDNGLEYFYVTEEGCKRAGLTKAGTKRATAFLKRKK